MSVVLAFFMDISRVVSSIRILPYTDFNRNSEIQK